MGTSGAACTPRPQHKQLLHYLLPRWVWSAYLDARINQHQATVRMTEGFSPQSSLTLYCAHTRTNEPETHLRAYAAGEEIEKWLK